TSITVNAPKEGKTAKINNVTVKSKDAPVTDIELDVNGTLNLKVNEKKQIHVLNADKLGDLTLSQSNGSVLKDLKYDKSTGLITVTAANAGDTVLTVKDAKNNLTKTINV